MNDRGDDELIFKLFPADSVRTVIAFPSTHVDQHNYYIQHQLGQAYCLKIIDDASIDRSNRCFQRLKFLAHRFACVPQPVRHGMCSNRQQRYLLSHWVRGEPVRRRLGQHSAFEDYASGIDYGLALKQLHMADRLDANGPATSDLQPSFALWCDQMTSLLVRAEHSENSIRLPCYLLDLIRTKTPIWTQIHTAWLHGRPGPEYGVLTPRTGLVLTGMTGSHTGHPYQDLAALIINTGTAWPTFLTGVFDGYFAGAAGSRSYQLLRLYIGLEILWRCYSQPAMLPVEQRRIQQILTAYREFHELVPNWYQPLPRVWEK